MFKKLGLFFKEKNILSLATSLIVALIGLLSFMLLTRTLEKELFGDWVLFITLSTFVDMLRFGLTSNALIRFASTDNVDIRTKYLGASYKIGLYAVLFFAVVLWATLGISNSLEIELNGGYKMFFLYYPFLALLNLSWNNSVSYFQALQRFERVLYIRLFTTVPFLLFLVLNYLYFGVGLDIILIAYLITNFIPSLFIFIKKWDGMAHISKADSLVTREMLTFGKFSMGTLVGTSLLKSADTIIIGLSPVLGSVGIALYAIPLKLTEFLAIPLRSFSIAAYPRMSLLSHKNDIEGLKKLFYVYSGAVTCLFIPVVLFCFIFSTELIFFLGGKNYVESMPLLVTIFRIFLIYSLIQPLDRFTGVALDSINRPKFNFYKVLLMASANIIGDLIAVFWFNSLEAVAVVTVLFTLLGIIAGYVYLNKFISVSLYNVFKEGILFFGNIGLHFKTIIRH